MAKKKQAAKTSARSARPKVAGRKQAKRVARAASPPRGVSEHGSKTHGYRHEVGPNPHHGSLTLDLDVSSGRGQHPPMPAFVGFTAEIADERWSDQFAFRLIAIQGGTVRVRITRVDRGLDELSWGANLVVHVLVVDQ
ncbi:MAG TPA: hypothetical protein VF306_12940 [Pirellulales bacterium]